jgi:uncharacterized membrane protein
VSPPRSFIAAAYPNPSAAEEAFTALERLAAEKALRLADAAIVVKTEAGRVELHQERELSAGEGAVGGGVAGALAGVLLGFPLALPAAGIALGAAVGAFDRGLDDKRMKRLGAELAPGHAALCALVAEADWKVVKDGMAPYAGELLVVELTPEAEEALRRVEQQSA